MYGPHVSRLLGTQEGSVLCGPVNPLLLGLNALTGLLFGMFTTHPLAQNAHLLTLWNTFELLHLQLQFLMFTIHRIYSPLNLRFHSFWVE